MQKDCGHNKIMNGAELQFAVILIWEYLDEDKEDGWA